jgi:P-type Ca2+ transporter type 2C
MIRILFFAGCASLFISIFDDNWASFYEGISIIFALLFIITLQTICEIVKNN